MHTRLRVAASSTTSMLRRSSDIHRRMHQCSVLVSCDVFFFRQTHRYLAGGEASTAAGGCCCSTHQRSCLLSILGIHARARIPAARSTARSTAPALRVQRISTSHACALCVGCRTIGCPDDSRAQLGARWRPCHCYVVPWPSTWNNWSANCFHPFVVRYLSVCQRAFAEKLSERPPTDVRGRGSMSPLRLAVEGVLQRGRPGEGGKRPSCTKEI